MFCVKNTWEILSFIIIFKVYALSRVYGKVIPSDQIEESKEQFFSETKDEFLQLLGGLENSKLQELPHELLENLDINSNAALVGETKKQDLLSLLRDKKLSGFLELIENAGVLNTFTNNNGYPITVFAPINEAFQSLGEEELKDSKDLQSIIFSHILFGEVFTKNLVDHESLQAMDGSSLLVNLSPNFTINGHLVLEDNILASNGVIYIVNGILTSPPKVSESTSETELPHWVREYLPPPLINKSPEFPSLDESEKPHETIENQSSINS